MRSATRRRSLQDIDKAPNIAADLSELRCIIARSVHDDVEKYAATIGLQSASVQFEEDVIEALLWCVLTHAAPKSKRYSEIRKELTRVSNKARAAQKILQRLRDALNGLELP